jgi:putative (di)nucleoside polyphosphate hydrolase
MSDVYRSCASIVLLRSSREGTEVLLLHKSRKRDAWQLPQGGVEKGETLEQAALRELKEEAGVDGNILGTSEKFYKYDFPASYRRFRPDNVCGQTLQFVLMSLAPDVKVQVDDREIDKHVWVPFDQVEKYIRRKKYLRTIHQLLEEGEKLLGGADTSSQQKHYS